MTRTLTAMALIATILTAGCSLDPLPGAQAVITGMGRSEISLNTSRPVLELDL